MIEDDVREVKDRSRRIETRLTKLMTHLGYETQATMPEWKNNRVEVPSISTAVKDILAVIPDDWSDRVPVPVMHKREMLCYVLKGE